MRDFARRLAALELEATRGPRDEAAARTRAAQIADLLDAMDATVPGTPSPLTAEERAELLARVRAAHGLPPIPDPA